jgi:hypothetical protein
VAEGKNMNGMDCFYLATPELGKKRNAQGLSTEDFRQLLSELKQRPASQQMFLRKLLHRAMANDAQAKFPVTNHAVPDPVSPS